ncbi:MAG: tRNA pseudouridine(13) synthase TruD [Planctomycetota bacterium]
MRLKCVPEDFRVRELLDFDEVADGRYFVHLVRKQKLSTAEALSRIACDCGVPRELIAYAGLKDRQAVTEQYVSIEGRSVDLRQPDLVVICVGRTDKPITSRQSRGNSFTIAIRDLAPSDASALRRGLPSLQKTGLPNYFDDQRFGCLRHSQGFAMAALLRGDHESALRSLIAEPSGVAITGDVKLKKALRFHWGDWQTCLEIARGPIYRPVFQHLVRHEGDFRGALSLLPQRMRTIHAFAYQSFLWNRALSFMLNGGIPSAQRLRIPTIAGDFVAWKYLDPDREEKLAAMSTPLYGPDGDGGSPPFRAAMLRELERAGIRPEDFSREEIPGMIWKEEQRAAIVKPIDAAQIEIRPDDRHEGRVMATLAFSLPRGAYATMVIKRLLARPWFDRARAEDRPFRGARAGFRREDRGPAHREGRGFREGLGPGGRRRFFPGGGAPRGRGACRPRGSRPPFDAFDGDSIDDDQETT